MEKLYELTRTLLQVKSLTTSSDDDQSISQNILQQFCLLHDWYDSPCGEDRFSI